MNRSSAATIPIAIGLYLICTLLFFYPCLKDLSTGILGIPADNMQHYWGFWWANLSFNNHLDFAHTTSIYYPQGTSLFFQPFSFYNVFLSLILTHLVNLPLTYNIIILHTFVLAGLGAFLLSRYLTGNIYGSLLAGFIYAFNPSHFAHSFHHDETASIQFIPFFVLFFIRSMKDGNKRDLFCACLFFFLTSISTWYYMVHSLIFLILAYGYLAWTSKKVFLWDVFWKMALIVGSTALLLSPWFVHMFSAWNTHTSAIERGGHGSAVADLLGFVIPHPNHWLAGLDPIKNISEMFTGNAWNKTVYLGVVPLTLAFVAFKKDLYATKKYFLGLLAFCIFSMGAFLHVLGHKLPFALPYMLIKITPFLKAARYPSRFMVFSYLFLSVIVAFAIKYICTLPKTKRLILLAVIPPLVFLDYFSINAKMTPIEAPSCYAAIKRDPDHFAILDLPLQNRTTLKRYMVYQTIHGIPTVSGDILRRVDNSLIDYLDFEDLKRQHGQLRENGVKYLVIHKKSMKNSNIQIEPYRTEYTTYFENNENLILQTY